MMVTVACAVPRAVEHSHFSGVLHADGVMTSGERIDAIEMIVLHPFGNLAGLIAGVCAYFKQGKDDDLHRDGEGLGLRKGKQAG